MAEQILSNQLAGFGEALDPGNYIARLTKLEAKSKDSDDKMNWVAATYEILEGEAEGLSISQMLFLKVTKSPKNGKFYARGIFEAQETAKNWGSPLPDFSLEEFMGGVSVAGAQLIQKLLAASFKKAGSPKLKIRVVAEKVQAKNERTQKWEDAQNDDGTQKFRNKVVVLGRLTPAANPSMESDADANADDGAMTFV